MRKIKFLTALFLCTSTNFVLAAAPTLGEVSDQLTEGAGILAKVMWAACIIVGIALIAAAFTQFQIHRRNPKLVPLATPVMYLILGVVAISLPFIDRISSFLGAGPGRSQGVESGARDRNTSNPNDIDAPIQ